MSRALSIVVIFIAVFCTTQIRAADLSAGVAIKIEFDDNDIGIITVAPGGPADLAGVKNGDALLGVGDRKIADIDEDELPGLIRGSEGSSVTLTVVSRGGEPRQVTIKRAMLGGAKANAHVPAPLPPLEHEAKKENQKLGNDVKPQPAGAGVVKFRRIGVKDPGINNIEAVSMLIPTDWKEGGGIKWFPDLSVQAMLLMKISDPQSGATIEFLPIQNFTFLTNPVFPMQQGTNYMGNIIWSPVEGVHELVQTFYTKQATPQLADAKVVGQEEFPKVEQIIAKNYGGQSKVRSGRVRYEYEANGRPWEEDVYMTAVYTPTQMGVFWSVTSSYTFRAARGQLDAMTPIMRATVDSSHLSADWYGGYMYVQQLFQNRMNQGIKNAAAISATVTKNSEEIRQMFSDSYKERQASQDRVSTGFSEYVRGVETYKNPYEDRPVQLPSGYNDAWVNNKGEYILSNQGGFDPNVGDTSDWRRMDRRDQGR